MTLVEQLIAAGIPAARAIEIVAANVVTSSTEMVAQEPTLAITTDAADAALLAGMPVKTYSTNANYVSGWVERVPDAYKVAMALPNMPTVASGYLPSFRFGRVLVIPTDKSVQAGQELPVVCGLGKDGVPHIARQWVGEATSQTHLVKVGKREVSYTSYTTAEPPKKSRI